ncbi:O-antigen/teichoic acid export membrane protein [Paenibacillus sp. JGP012]|nr:O-antigen/teichoic acid export membrane protein [Paenibacillus sp. JGP012]
MSIAIAKGHRPQSMIKTILMTSIINILIMGITTITSILTARVFGAEGKGELAAILFWPGFLTNLATLGLPTSLIYHIKKNKDLTPMYTGIGFMVQIPVSIIIGIITWFGISSWLSNYSADVIYIAKVYILSLTPVFLLAGVLAATAQGTEKFHIFNLARLFATLINLFGLLLLWLSGTLSLERAILVSFMSHAIVLVFYCYTLRMHISTKMKEFQIRSKLYLFSFAGRVSGVELFNTLYNQFDKIIILALLTPRDFGLYSVVYALSRMFNVIQTAIANVIFPKAAGLEKEKVFSLVGRSFRSSMVLMIIIVIPSLFIGRYLMGLLYGKEFLEASFVFYLLSLECIVAGGAGILASSFNALGRPEVILVGQVSSVSVMIFLFFYITPTLGLNGVGITLLVGSIIRMFVSMLALKMICKIPLKQIVYDKGDFEFLRERLYEKNILKRNRNIKNVTK